MAARDQVRYPPELWINGRHLTGTLSESQLREELDQERSRAQVAIQSGAPLTQLYERLVAEETAQHPEGPGMGSGPRWGRVTLPPFAKPAAAPLAAPLDLTGAPSRGPRIAPVTLILIGSLDSHETYETARATYEVWLRHADSLRLVFLHAPRTDTSRRIALLLAQVALFDAGRFWRLFDSMLEQLPRSFPMIRYKAVESLIQREGGYALIEAGLHTPAAELQLRHDLEQVRRLGSIEYTPVVLVNGPAGARPAAWRSAGDRDRAGEPARPLAAPARAAAARRRQLAGPLGLASPWGGTTRG